MLEGLRADMQTLLARLVSIPTENPPGAEYEACLEELEAAGRALGVEFERVACGGEPRRTALRASVGTSGPALVLHGHYDVVPALTRDQFAPRIKGDTLFGRGSSDMKGGLVAMLYAAHALAATGALARGRLELLFVPDEETGGAAASALLASSGRLGVNAIGMVLGEPTSGRIWNASRGAITLEVVVRGRAAHVALQHHGTNAVERALPLLERLFALKRQLDARGSVLLVGGRVDAGTNFNLVPDRCCFTIDRRINPDENFESEKDALLAILDDARRSGVDLETRIIQEGRASATAIDGPVGRALVQAVADVCGDLPIVETCPGLLETRFYAARGIPAFAYGPGMLAVSHGPNEFVRLSAVAASAKVYALTAVCGLEGRPVSL